MSEKETFYWALQKKIDKSGFHFLELDAPDYGSFDFIIKETRHPSGSGNWHGEYDIFNKQGINENLLINSWQISKHLKSLGSSWKGGWFESVLLTDCDGVKRILVFNEMKNVTYPLSEVIPIHLFRSTYEGNDFQSMINSLSIFCYTYSNWSNFDSKKTTKAPDVVISELQRENRKLKDSIEKIKSLLKDI